ncbi:MAG: hypothetical protein ACKVU2_16315 [Saprospiraceae bacterium]
MQKRWLNDFEFQITPSTWNAAQELILAGAVRDLQEVERHFWVAKVTDEDFQFEVETIITPLKIKAFTCECWGEGRRLMCAHIAAALFKIRQFLEQKNEARQAKAEAEQREKSGKLSVQNILDTISADELSAFVRDYARRDRDFALALKTRFAAVFTSNDNPYLLVLEAALPRNADSRILLASEFRRLSKALDNLEAQAAAAASGGNSKQVLQIASAILLATSPLLAKSPEARRDKILRYCQSVFRHLTQLPQEHLSPELRENRRVLLFGYLSRPDNSAEFVSTTVVPFLAQEASDQGFFSEIQTLFDQTPFPAPTSLLHLFLAALAQRKLPEASLRVLQDYTDRPGELKNAVLALNRMHYWEAALMCGEYYLGKNLFLAGQRREIEDMLLAAAEKAGDRPRHAAYLRQRFQQHGNESVLLRLKALAGPDWLQEREKLLSELRKSDDMPKIIQLLAVEGDLDALANALEKTGGLDTLHHYEHLFWPDRATFLRDYYLGELAAHLDDHFGKQASKPACDLLEGLVRKGLGTLAKDIAIGLATRFPDRKSLPGELAEVFPKALRGTILIGTKIKPTNES